MKLQNFHQEEIKSTLLEFTIKSVEKFLEENPNLEFYAFAYDCNSEYAEVGLCFNTEADFRNTLEYYQSGQYAEHYQSEEAIKDLKLNTGDWEYQCFESINVLTEEYLTEIINKLPDDDYKSWNEFTKYLMKLFCEVLADFIQTDTFHKIPKTKNFTVFCIDHDEDIEDALKRFNDIKKI